MISPSDGPGSETHPSYDIPRRPESPALYLAYNETKSFGGMFTPSIADPGRPVSCPASYRVWFDARFNEEATAREINLTLALGPGAPPHVAENPKSFLLPTPQSLQIPFDLNITGSTGTPFGVSVRVDAQGYLESIVESAIWACRGE